MKVRKQKCAPHERVRLAGRKVSENVGCNFSIVSRVFPVQLWLAPRSLLVACAACLNSRLLKDLQ